MFNENGKMKSGLRKIREICGFCLISAFLLLTLAPVSTVLAQTPKAGQEGMFGISYMCANGDPCQTFGQLISAVKGITTFAVVNIALPFSVVVIVWAGWIYLNSGGNPGERAKANKMFTSVLWGIFWVLGAWLVVTLIMNALTDPSKIIPLLK